jgi:hypothetical protein
MEKNITLSNMQTKFKIVETEDYILAVSDEEIKEGDYQLVPMLSKVEEVTKDNIHLSYMCYKIIAHQSKGNVPELDLPLLTERTVEDDVEKLAKEEFKGFEDQYDKWRFGINGFIKGHKSATKIYSKEDLIKVIAMSKMAKTHDGLIDMDAWISNGYEGAEPAYTEDEIIQTLNQSKTPKRFVVENGAINNCNQFDIETGCELQNCKCENNEKFEFTITSNSNGKGVLVGTYE